MNLKTRWTFIARAEGKNFDPEDHVYFDFSDEEIGVTSEDIIADPATALLAALDAAKALGLPKGSHRSGCFQVQCEHGIFSEAKGVRFNPKFPERITFNTWEQLELMV
jgi:hypothetical protein